MNAQAGGPGENGAEASPESTGTGGPGVPAPREVYVFRAPKYTTFLGTGALAGVVLGVILTMLAGDRAAEYSLATRLGYLCVVLGLLGALLGGTVAVIVDRSRR